MQNNPEYIIIHTAALKGDDYDIEDIDEWHRERGWQMVGYHYFICKDGTIQQGRPDDLHGAHCRGMNTKSLGICFQGHGDHELWTRDQKLSFQRLAAQKRKKYYISVENVHGHRRYATKTCPGTLIRMEAVQALYSSAQGIQRIKKVQPADPIELPTKEITDYDLSP